MTVPKEVARLYYEILVDEAQSSDVERSQRLAEIDRERAALEEKLGTADERFVEGALEPDSYARLKGRYGERMRAVEGERAGLVATQTDLLAHAAYGLALVSNLPRCYAEAGLDGKRDLVGLLFPGRLVYRDGRVETPEVHPVLGLFDGRRAEMKEDRPPIMAAGPLRYRVRDLNPCYRRERAAS